MISDHEWSILAGKLLKRKAVKAPPFLWTRVLSAIESEERRQEGIWWMQWHWIKRVTLAAVILVSIGVFYMMDQGSAPLEDVLDGRTTVQGSLHLANVGSLTIDDSAFMLVGADS